LTSHNQTTTTTSQKSHFRIGGSADFNIPFKFLTGLDGQADRYTPAAIAARASGQISLEFILPNNGGQFLRIYSVLDPDHEMSEVHEDNNIGWTALTLGGGPTHVEDQSQDLPSSSRLDPNYPNPFNPTTRISYALAGATPVTLKVYDLLGREVAVLVDQWHAAGMYTVPFDAVGLASGIYFYRLTAGGFDRTLKLAVI
jgi:hypothetical protein